MRKLVNSAHWWKMLQQSRRHHIVLHTHTEWGRKAELSCSSGASGQTRGKPKQCKARLPGSPHKKQMCARTVRNTCPALGSRKGLCDLQSSCSLLPLYWKEDIGKVLDANPEKSVYKDHL